MNRPSKTVQTQIWLEAFVRDTAYVGPDAVLVTDLDELPIRFHGHLQSHAVWRAWKTECCLWFIEGWLLNVGPSLTSGPVLELLFYNMDGLAVAAGVWQRDRDKRWHLQKIIEPDDCFNMTAPERIHSLLWT